MNIELNLGLLQDTKLSPDEFTALYLVYRKGYSYFDSLNLDIDWDSLQERGYVKLGENIGLHSVRQTFIDLFANDFDSMFAQLISTYPMKVSTRTGIRVLHAADPNAKSNLKAKNKYRKIVGSKAHVHKRIMLLLEKQLRIDRDNLAYLQNLETWINNHTWEKYEDIDEKDESKPQRITRAL